MTPSQLKDFLRITCKEKMPVLIVGAPGIGKSDVVDQISNELGFELIISHPVVSDPTDYKGMPWVSDGEAHFLPFSDLKRLIDAEKPTIFFLDDLGQASQSVQSASMNLLLARRINNHIVSDKVVFIAASNRRSDKAGVQGLLEPVKSRFVSIIELEVSFQEWCSWAIDHDMPVELLSFIRFKPSLLHDFKPTNDLVNTPCPRTVSNVGRLVNAGLPEDIQFEAIKGSAGEGFATEFIAFSRIYKNLPNPDHIIMNPEKAKIPDDVATKFALCGALSVRANDNNFGRVLKYADRLGPEYSVLIVRDSIQRNTELLNTDAFIRWSVANSSYHI